MSVLIVNADVVAEIKAALARAWAAPVPLEVVMRVAAANQESTTVTLEERRASDGARPPAQHVMLPFGFRASIAFEYQPVGLCRHLSISVREGERGVMPSPPFAKLIAELFEFKTFPPEDGRVWIEEFDAERWALNLVEVVDPLENKH